MFTKGSEAVQWLIERGYFGSCPGLERITELLRLLGNPEKSYPTIHVAGTNGKGSTTRYLANLLRSNGLKVGTFNSPFIKDFAEQVEINGQEIPDADLVKLGNLIKPLVEQMDAQKEFYGITEFEILTGLAFYYFKGQVDVAIIEVGMGGLLDSTNVIKPELAAITTIGLDHTAFLGDTIEKIAYQKAGIIKENVPLVVGNVSEEALKVIEIQAKEKNAKVYTWKDDFHSDYRGFVEQQFEEFDFVNNEIKLKGLDTPLIGHQQVENAAVALEMYYLYTQKHNLSFDKDKIIHSLLQTKWPARMEIISQKPLVIMDGAHNPHAIKRLKENLLTDYQDYRVKILFSAIVTKDISTMLEELLEIPNVEITMTTFNDDRAVKLEDYQDWQPRIKINSNWQVAYDELIGNLKSDELLMIAGSLYFSSEVRSKIK
ncbi:MAG TPA: bifunctional folylpolyglutamate synthase/dihydrofolate synthase [Candidatus Companilactobacillus pullicola]|uniref:tetrahydrofolate synthase n=2 Tax=Companilactobacillus TaxID=2767879 RepID=A0A9D1ZQW0_9LACO|nr:bifunctional folylpolyglutamate synthase/dihydrofolate synthase [Candidatus Companilactobacillus pullicola]